MSDPLSQFRKRDSSTQTARGSERKAYKAYEVAGQGQECLHIIRPADTSHYPEYRYKMDVMHSASGTQIMVVFSFMTVKIVGKNLHDLPQHIANRDCISLQEFHPKEWPAPSEDEPIIERIEITIVGQ